MIDLYFSPTPNGLKIRLFLEEAGLPHRILPVRLSAGEQFAPSFVAVSPNAKIPAIERTGQLLPRDPRERLDALQWLFWQMAGLGPMAGQAGYFRGYAPEAVPFAIDRYTRELQRLYGVLDRRLAGREFIVGDGYSIADVACYPWIVPHAGHGQELTAFPHLARWFHAVSQRPATQRTYDGVEDVYARPGKPVASAVQ